MYIFCDYIHVNVFLIRLFCIYEWICHISKQRFVYVHANFVPIRVPIRSNSSFQSDITCVNHLQYNKAIRFSELWTFAVRKIDWESAYHQNTVSLRGNFSSCFSQWVFFFFTRSVGKICEKCWNWGWKEPWAGSMNAAAQARLPFGLWCQ